jgi:hypothetical protein
MVLPKKTTMKKTGYCISIGLQVLFTVINGMAQRRGHPVGTIKVTT